MALLMRNRLAVLAVMASLVCVPLSARAGDISRTEGDYWTYEVSTTVSDIPVSGTITCTFVGDDTLTIDDAGIDVRVLKVTGQFQGSVTSAGLTASVFGVYDGYRYEERGSLGVLKDDLTSLENISVGYDELRITSFVERKMTISYSSPLMSEFDPDTARVGDKWNETVTVRISSSYDDGNISYDADNSTDVTVGFEITSGGSEQTYAGEFEVLRIVQTSGHVNETFSYAEDVGQFVRYERYENGSDEAVYVAILMGYSYEKRNDDSYVVTLMTGVFVASITVLGIAAALAFSRKRRTASTTESEGFEDATERGSGDEPDEDKSMEDR